MNKLFSITMTEEELHLFSEFQKEFGLIRRSSRMHSTNNLMHNLDRRRAVKPRVKTKTTTAVVPSTKSGLPLAIEATKTAVPPTPQLPTSTKLNKVINLPATIEKSPKMSRISPKSKKGMIVGGALAGIGALGAGIAIKRRKSVVNEE